MCEVIAVISDIHGNSLALEAVLQDIDARQADLIVNLGDALFGPLDPKGTAAMLMQRPDMVHIMGNCDEILLEESSLSPTYNYVKPLLQAFEMDFIHTFRRTWSFEDLLFCHGTPWNNTSYLMERIQTDGSVHYKQPELLAAELHRIQERIIFCGHSHRFHSMELPGGQKVVNPGSVGLPAYEDEWPYSHVMESGTSSASYCLCTRNREAGGWMTRQILVPYDSDTAADQARRNDRPDYEVAIRTGRMRGDVMQPD